MKEFNISKEIEILLKYALKHNLIEKWDVVQSRNSLLDLLRIDEPYYGEIEEITSENPVSILKNILDYAGETEILPIDTITYRDLLDAKIMGILMPRSSEIINNFNNIYNTKGSKAATTYYYNLSTHSNYIRLDRTNKNLYWKEDTPYGEMEITINLSKPEKDPRDIAASKLKSSSNYPKCLLCLENVGYAGNINHPGRGNHRVIPIELLHEQWYLQYSPYLYYNEHCILFHESHIPMSINENTFRRIIDFVEKFPHYFIGSNADLPIVGGSILTHEHYQGGNHVFPMVKASIEHFFKSEEFQTIKGGIVKWPLSVIRLSSKDKEELIAASSKILDVWRGYIDESVDILPHSIIKGEKVLHNTITPIARINKYGEYEIDLVLRNNRTSEEHPLGIFHPHQHLHHIKKENIGLIEVMGLAVLPGRLKEELNEIRNILSGQEQVNDFNLCNHLKWIDEMILEYGTDNTTEEALRIIKREIGKKFTEILTNSGVFKRDKVGREGFIKFINKIGFRD